MSKLYFCKKCNKEISRRSKSGLCRSCVQKKRMKDPKNHPMFGKKPKAHKAPNCPCCICKAKRGETKGNKSPSWKGDEALERQIYHCIEKDCKNIISYSNFINGSKKCKSCSKKGKNNHRYGIKLSEKIIQNLSKLNSGKNNPMFGVHRFGKSNPMYGKYHSKKTKEKIKLKHLNTHHSEKTKKLLSIIRGGTGISGELSEYGAGFDSNLKEKIRFRDGYKCKNCGCSQLENNKQLACHHIDYNKKNNNINNLISLCNSCHSKTNYNRKKWVRKFNLGISIPLIPLFSIKENN